MKELLEKLRIVRIAQEISHAFDVVIHSDDLDSINDLVDNYDIGERHEIIEACNLFFGYNDGDMDRQLIMICDEIINKQT